MQQYVKDRFKSRGLDQNDNLICEFCGKYVLEDIHHIKSSHRGPRKHSKDGSDLIGVCRKCHDKIHMNNNYEMRENLLKIVSKII